MSAAADAKHPGKFASAVYNAATNKLITPSGWSCCGEPLKLGNCSAAARTAHAAAQAARAAAKEADDRARDQFDARRLRFLKLYAPDVAAKLEAAGLAGDDAAESDDEDEQASDDESTLSATSSRPASRAGTPGAAESRPGTAESRPGTADSARTADSAKTTDSAKAARAIGAIPTYDAATAAISADGFFRRKSLVPVPMHPDAPPPARRMAKYLPGVDRNNPHYRDPEVMRKSGYDPTAPARLPLSVDWAIREQMVRKEAALAEQREAEEKALRGVQPASAAEAVMAIRSMRKDVDNINVATSGLEIVDRICVTSDAGAAAVHRNRGVAVAISAAEKHTDQPRLQYLLLRILRSLCEKASTRRAACTDRVVETALVQLYRRYGHSGIIASEAVAALDSIATVNPAARPRFLEAGLLPPLLVIVRNIVHPPETDAHAPSQDSSRGAAKRAAAQRGMLLHGLNLVGMIADHDATSRDTLLGLGGIRLCLDVFDAHSEDSVVVGSVFTSLVACCASDEGLAQLTQVDGGALRRFLRMMQRLLTDHPLQLRGLQLFRRLYDTPAGRAEMVRVPGALQWLAQGPEEGNVMIHFQPGGPLQNHGWCAGDMPYATGSAVELFTAALACTNLEDTVALLNRAIVVDEEKQVLRGAAHEELGRLRELNGDLSGALPFFDEGSRRSRGARTNSSLWALDRAKRLAGGTQPLRGWNRPLLDAFARGTYLHYQEAGDAAAATGPKSGASRKAKQTAEGRRGATEAALLRLQTPGYDPEVVLAHYGEKAAKTETALRVARQASDTTSFDHRRLRIVPATAPALLPGEEESAAAVVAGAASAGFARRPGGIWQHVDGAGMFSAMREGVLLPAVGETRLDWQQRVRGAERTNQVTMHTLSGATRAGRNYDDPRRRMVRDEVDSLDEMMELEAERGRI